MFSLKLMVQRSRRDSGTHFEKSWDKQASFINVECFCSLPESQTPQDKINLRKVLQSLDLFLEPVGCETVGMKMAQMSSVLDLHATNRM